MGLIKLIVPEDLHRRLKADAAGAGMTLGARCVAVLQAGTGLVLDADEKREAEMQRRRRAVNASVVLNPDYPGKIKTPPLFRSGCPSCGALTGHQKWCKR